MTLQSPRGLSDMTPKTRRTLLELGIALDAVIIATGFAYFAPDDPLFVFGALLGAIAVAAWIRGAVAGLGAAMFSIVALLVSFDSVLDPKRVVIFGLTAAVICVAVEMIRWTGGQAILPVELDRRDRLSSTPVPPRFLLLGLPLLVFLIYTNFSDIAIRNFGIPSVLQPVIVILGVAVWHYRARLGTALVTAQPLTLALAAYAFVLFCSSIWAADVHLADERIVDNVKNLAMFVIIATLAASWRALRIAIAVLAAAASVLAIITMHQALTHDYSHEYLGFARIQMAHLYGNVVELRPAGPVGDPNFYAQFLLMIVPLAFFGALAETRRSRRLALLVATAIVAAGTLLTYSRGAMVALGVMALITLTTLRIRAKHLGALAAIGIVALLAAGDDRVARARQRRAGGLVDHEAQAAARVGRAHVRRSHAARRRRRQLLEVLPALRERGRLAGRPVRRYGRARLSEYAVPRDRRGDRHRRAHRLRHRLRARVHLALALAPRIAVAR